MLSKSTEGSVSNFRARLCQVAVVSVFAVSACWNLHADQPADKDEVSKPVARIASVPKGDSKETTFSLPRLAPWEDLPPNNNGYAAIRVHQLYKHPALAFAGIFVDPAMDAAWKTIAKDQAVGKRAALGLGFPNVDHAIFSLHANVENKETQDDDPSHSGNVTLGTDGMVLRFIKPIVHDDLKAALHVDRVAKVSEQGGLSADTLGGKTTTEFVDDMLNSIFTEGAVTKQLATDRTEKEYTEEQLAQLKKAWSQVDGGILTLCSVLPDSLGYVEDELDKHADLILSQAASIGMGVDVAKTTDALMSTPVHFRLALLPRDGIELNQLAETIRVGISEIKAETKLIEGDEEDNGEAEKILEALETLKVFKSQTGDGVLVTFEVPLQSFIIFGDF